MLTVFEIYPSIQGESTHAGRPCTFVRLAACDLRCVWCDTPYAFTGGRKMSIDDVAAAVGQIGIRLVELTGGEPMLQPETPALMARLIKDGHTVLLETGGHISLEAVPDDVITIMDVKCPGSGESARMHWPNIDLLSPHDEVKFVIANRADFDFARDVIDKFNLSRKVSAILLSPVHGALAPADLAKWMLETAVPARLQIQAHKYIWSPEARGV